RRPLHGHPECRDRDGRARLPRGGRSAARRLRHLGGPARGDRHRHPVRRRRGPGPHASRPEEARTGGSDVSASDRERRTGPRTLDVHVTLRYRLEWIGLRLLIGGPFDGRVSGLEHWPKAPFQLVSNHHNGWDPMILMGSCPMEPRITWFGPIEADFSRGFKNRVMGFFGGMIPYSPDGTTLTSAVRAVRRVFAARGVLGIFAEGRIGFRESELLPFEEGAAAF